MIVGVSHYIIRAPLYTYSMSSPTTTTTTTAKTTVAANNTGKDIFSKVLVAIDGSDPSMDAADYAIYISEKYTSELCALNFMGVGF
jgi:hypothetical protein